MAKKTQDNSQGTLFDMDRPPEKSGMLYVSRMGWISGGYEKADDILAGFDEIYAVTYSHSLPRIENVMRRFKKGEVIVGCADLVGMEDVKLFASQIAAVNYTGRHQYLKSRIDSGEFRFFVLDEIVSHQKIYLLKADNGKVRTILASANFSDAAWNGNQGENIVVCDDPSCFYAYITQYIDLRDNHCGRIEKNAAVIDEDFDNIEELPVVKRIRKSGAVLLDVSERTAEDIEYAYFQKKLDPKVASLLARRKEMEPDKKGLIEITALKIEKIVGRAKKESAAVKERRREFPQMLIDYERGVITLNGGPEWDLNPPDADVEADVRLFERHMSGFNGESFVGDVARLRNIYWKVLNYMFLSPFIARIRHEIGIDDWLRHAPMYLLISGPSDAGKTAFVKLVRKMMFNDRYSAGLLPNKLFSTDASANIKRLGHGYPAIIDEVTSAQWAHAGNIVKNDSDLLLDGEINHPCFILLANRLSGMKKEISKRVMVFNPDCKMIGNMAFTNGRFVKDIGEAIGNAFYRRYAGMILDRLPVAFEKAGKNMPPDIWALSSGICREIFDKFGVLPDLKPQTWEDYVGEKNISESALRIVADEYANNPGAFTAIRRLNQLVIDFEPHEQRECQIILSRLVNEMPVICRCRQQRAKAILNLRETEKILDISFRTGFSRRMLGGLKRMFGKS